MGALDGTMGERTRQAFDAGVDLVLHCNGVMAEMAEIVDAAVRVSPTVRARIARGEKLRRREREDFDRRAAELRFAELMATP
jgi:beta-N-acetylhexosaminidase